MIILWLVCGVATVIAAGATVIAAGLASRSRQARYMGRAAVGVLFIVGVGLLRWSTSRPAATTAALPTRAQQAA